MLFRGVESIFVYQTFRSLACSSSGYTGEFCEQEINECTSDPCMHGGECVDQINMYTCSCLPGKNTIRPRSKPTYYGG